MSASDVPKMTANMMYCPNPLAPQPIPVNATFDTCGIAPGIDRVTATITDAGGTVLKRPDDNFTTPFPSGKWKITLTDVPVTPPADPPYTLTIQTWQTPDGGVTYVPVGTDDAYQILVMASGAPMCNCPTISLIAEFFYGILRVLKKLLAALGLGRKRRRA
jgi:hypothetical protein